MTQSTTTQDAALMTMARWVSTIADNIRNPISGISAALSILEHQLRSSDTDLDSTTPLVDDALARIRLRLTSLSEYVSELIDFAKPAVIQPSPTDLNSLVNATKNQTLRDLPGVQVATKFSCRTSTVKADHDRLRIVLSGIMRNAAEAALTTTSQNKPQVSIAVDCTHEGFTITVSDNGPGFSKDAMHHACEPFYSTKEAGTGLGLAIAAKVVRAHGGEITIGKSTSLGGAKVSLYLPESRKSGPDHLLLPVT